MKSVSYIVPFLVLLFFSVEGYPSTKKPDCQEAKKQMDKIQQSRFIQPQQATRHLQKLLLLLKGESCIKIYAEGLQVLAEINGDYTLERACGTYRCYEDVSLLVQKNTDVFDDKYIEKVNKKMKDLREQWNCNSGKGKKYHCPYCSSGEKIRCYTGQPKTRGKGACHDGYRLCENGRWLQCAGEKTPSPERCNGVDDDCDGKIDEDWPRKGTPCERGFGECKALGIYVCREDGKELVCNASSKFIPQEETCNNKDDDCDGRVDNQTGQATPLTEACYHGDPKTKGKGVCKEGLRTCYHGKWSSCVGEILPKKELCGNGLDDDCDGRIDNGCCKCQCSLQQGVQQCHCKKSQMWMSFIKGGTFRLGDNNQADYEEKSEYGITPAKTVEILDFWIDQHEVTVEQYSQCTRLGKCGFKKNQESTNWNHSQNAHPMNGVSWKEAEQYCQWVGKRLPTEAEWEYAAKGKADRRYPCKACTLPFCLNVSHQKCLSKEVKTTQGDVTPENVFDLTGNLSEWTLSCGLKSYNSLNDTFSDKHQRKYHNCKDETRVYRGGDFLVPEGSEHLFRSVSRRIESEKTRSQIIGFRCVSNKKPCVCENQ